MKRRLAVETAGSVRASETGDCDLECNERVNGVFCRQSYHIISEMRSLLREPRPLVRYKSQPNAKTPRKKTKLNKC